MLLTPGEKTPWGLFLSREFPIGIPKEKAYCIKHP